MNWKTIYQFVYKEETRWVFMFKYYFLSTVIILITACSNDGIYFENSYLIENISIIHPIEEAENQMTLVISENKIINQFKTNQVKVSQKNIIYDGYEKYIMPGLWDAHIHFAYETDLANSMPDLFLAHGVTSLRDTGGEINFVNSFKQKSLENPKTTPRVKIAGPLVDGNYNVYDGSSPNYPELSIRTTNVIDLKKQVQILVDKNVDFLKAYEMLSPTQFDAIAEIAKENNLKLTGHVPLSMSVIDASNLGLNSIEHLRNIELSMSIHSERFLKERKEILENKKQIKGSQLRRTLHKKQRFKSIYSLDSSKIKKVVSILAKNKTWQVPTLRLYKNYVYQKYKDSSYTSYFKMLPKNKKEEWISEIKKIPRNLNMDLKPSENTNLFGMDSFFNEIISLHKKKMMPNKILLSGKKGLGKSTLAYHIINCILSFDEDHFYDEKNYKIDRSISLHDLHLWLLLRLQQHHQKLAQKQHLQ